MTVKQLREQAERARDEAEHQHKTSEYPRYGRAAHLEVASETDKLADLLAEIGEQPPEETGNAHADRRARRVYWLRRKAAEMRVTSARSAASSHDMGSRRPMGQPIQGTGARARAQYNAIDKQNKRADRAHREYKEAEDLERRAKAAANNKAIYRTDPEGLVKLRAKLASLEAKRERLKATKPKALPLLNYRSETVRVGSLYRDDTQELPQVEMSRAEYKRRPADMKGTRTSESGAHRVRSAMVRDDGGLGLVAVFITDSKEHAKPGADEQKPDGSGQAPPAYILSNLGANIRRVREQIEQREADEAREERAPRTIGAVDVVDNLEYMKVELHFPSKPDAETRALIKGHGFRWVRTAGCWSRGIGTQTEHALRELARHMGEELN